jgi:uncharacterized protein YerC
MLTTLSYSPFLNRFIDDDDIVIHDISSLFDHWQIQKWVNEGAIDTTIQSRTGEWFFLTCLNQHEESHLLDYYCFQESFGFKTDRASY